MNYLISLGIVAILPVVISILFYILDNSTRFGKLSYMTKQVIWGVVFGLLAVVGTEWSIPVEGGASLNCRDAAVITAGLFWGGPAGIIAGVIGGVERWFSVLWGVGAYTRVACSISTFLAGVFSALLRKFIFKKKTPEWFISAAVGIVIEVVHMLMVILTNMDSPRDALEIIRVCTLPMVISNGISVMLSSVFLILLAEVKKQKNGISGKKQKSISQLIQRWLLGSIIVAYVLTTVFVFRLQNKMSVDQGDKLLTIALDETEGNIRDISNENLLDIAYNVSNEIDSGTYDIQALADKYGIVEINVVDGNGIITGSTAENLIGFDMSSGEQASEFMCLLGNTDSFAQDYGPISYDSEVWRKYAGVKCGDGFIQVGYDFVQLKNSITNEITDTTKRRHVGESGYLLIVDEDYNVISAPGELEHLNIRDRVEAVQKDENVTFTAELYSKECCVRYRFVEGYYIASVLPTDELLYSRDMAIYVNSFMVVIIFAVLFTLIYLLIDRFVVNQIERVNVSLSKITEGDLNEVVDVRSNSEMAKLSEDINMTVDTLKDYIDEASKRIDQELEYAKNIQRSALPNVYPVFSKRTDLDIFASMHPAKEVGGDFYDFYLTDDNKINFLVADVSGKGIPAAMFMMRAKTELKSLTEAGLELPEVFRRGNENLCGENDAGMFVTVWQGQMDLINGKVRFVNAGHNPFIIRHGDGRFEFVKIKADFVLGGMDGMRYTGNEIVLEPGDVIYLYTDGVTEATNSASELYGNERLLEILNNAQYSNMEQLCNCVKADVDSFVDGAPQFDDITMLAIRYNGKQHVPSIHFENVTADDISVATEFVEKELERLKCPQKTVTQIDVAIDEVMSNIVRYGYQDVPGPVTVEVIEQSEPGAVQIRFYDKGIPYDPTGAKEPDITLSAEEKEIGGLGIYIVKKTMDEVSYRYENGTNILTILKKY